MFVIYFGCFLLRAMDSFMNSPTFSLSHETQYVLAQGDWVETPFPTQEQRHAMIKSLQEAEASGFTQYTKEEFSKMMKKTLKRKEKGNRPKPIIFTY